MSEREPNSPRREEDDEAELEVGLPPATEQAAELEGDPTTNYEPDPTDDEDDSES